MIAWVKINFHHLLQIWVKIGLAMKFHLLVKLEFPKGYKGFTFENLVLWVLHSFQDFCERFGVGGPMLAPVVHSVELLDSAAVARLYAAPPVDPLESRDAGEPAPKSSSMWLKPIAGLGSIRPLDVVVYTLFCIAVGFVAGKLLIRLLT